ncbi:hypothetical protein K0M31_010419 [Melipona bicolor]|uniref:Uncharacterized protein n=1 Tax=Melipona bicolor TaxID=60889 RepID=A0AA40FLY1_9HYME|nr:hypothetical protein K0M31_010419 [Melipona bicolor]
MLAGSGNSFLAIGKGVKSHKVILAIRRCVAKKEQGQKNAYPTSSRASSLYSESDLFAGNYPRDGTTETSMTMMEHWRYHRERIYGRGRRFSFKTNSRESNGRITEETRRNDFHLGISSIREILGIFPVSFRADCSNHQRRSDRKTQCRGNNYGNNWVQ